MSNELVYATDLHARHRYLEKVNSAVSANREQLIGEIVAEYEAHVESAPSQEQAIVRPLRRAALADGHEPRDREPGNVSRMIEAAPSMAVTSIVIGARSIRATTGWSRTFATRLLARLLIDPVTWRRRDLYCRRYGHLWSMASSEPRCLWCGTN